tara:strand:+ start:505 stop:822 length:318 start_codon:yes stop_codon:yes gene_type:complete
MNTTITEVEYLTETKFRAEVKKTLPYSVNSKRDTEACRGFAINVRETSGAETHHSTTFRVKVGRSSSVSQLDVERHLVLAGFEMVEASPEYLNTGISIAWRKAAN